MKIDDCIYRAFETNFRLIESKSNRIIEIRSNHILESRSKGVQDHLFHNLHSKGEEQ